MKRTLRHLLAKTAHMTHTLPLPRSARLGDASDRTRLTRFVILARSRTGSNLLRSLLNSHPQIVVFSEVFRNPDAIDWGFPGYRQSPRDARLMRQDPVAFLENRIFAGQPRNVAAVGFKLFYYHAREPQLAPLWPYLAQADDIKIIHLKRRNILRTHLSRERAIRTDEWARLDDAPRPETPIHLDYERCLADFEQTRRWEEEMDAFFAGREMLQLTYEALVADMTGEMDRVQAFLGVPRRDLTPLTKKQAQKPLSAAIANYDELKARFAGTPWAAFFED
jgi:LPS sulfotransferase NodH